MCYYHSLCLGSNIYVRRQNLTHPQRQTRVYTHKKTKEFTHKNMHIYKRKNKTRYRWGFKQSDSGQRFSPLSISRKIVLSLDWWPQYSVVLQTLMYLFFCWNSNWRRRRRKKGAQAGFWVSREMASFLDMGFFFFFLQINGDVLWISIWFNSCERQKEQFWEGWRDQKKLHVKCLEWV